MKKIIYLIALLLLIVQGVNAQEQFELIETDINITSIGYYNSNLNESFVNVTIVTEDDTLNYYDWGNNTNFQTTYEIDLVRSIKSCEETDLSNLTRQCLDKLTKFDPKNEENCEQARGRQFESLQQCQSNEANLTTTLTSTEGNYTTCITGFESAKQERDNCQSQLGALKLKNEEQGVQKWWYYVIVYALGNLTFWFLGVNTRKSRGPKSKQTREHGADTTGKVLIPKFIEDKIKERTEKKEGEEENKNG